MDQPLYATGKKIQWTWPDTYGEDKFVLLLGPLHIEQSFLGILGQLMEGCGWVGVVAASGVMSAGSAEAILKVFRLPPNKLRSSSSIKRKTVTILSKSRLLQVVHITRARVMHEITAVTLYGLLRQSYEECNPGNEMEFESWVDEQSEKNPTFKFWQLVLNLEVLLLTFVRSVRNGDFQEFKETIAKMLPWYFTFDHQNYARWLSVHLMDLQELQIKAPDVYRQFAEGRTYST